MIITDENSLRVKCESVLPSEQESLLDQLEKELEESLVPGIGLAAPQIGVAKTMAIVRLDGLKIDLINCNIINCRGQFTFKEEGCLSFPDMMVSTLRYKQITIENNAVKPYKFIATGLIAVVIQHEIDHWHSRLLPDFSLENR